MGGSTGSTWADLPQVEADEAWLERLGVRVSRRCSPPTGSCPSEGMGKPDHQSGVHPGAGAPEPRREDQHRRQGRWRYQDNIFVEWLWWKVE